MAFDARLFLSTFGLIFLAELPDKTVFATLLLATRHRPRAVFLGAAAAFFLQSLIAVAFGSLFGLLPPRLVRLAAGLLFLVFAVDLWRRRGDEPERDGLEAERLEKGSRRAVWASFLVIFAAEWGDLTQLATAALAAKHRAPLTVLTASTLALWTVSGLAAAAGGRLKSLLDPARLQRLAAAAFALVGACLLVR